MRNQYGIRAVKAENVPDVKNLLPENFKFEISKSITISRGNFTFTCQGVCIDRLYKSNRYFILCPIREGREYTYNIIVNQFPVKILKNISSFYFNEEMIHLGFILLRKPKKWRILFISGIDRGKIFSVDSFLDLKSRDINEGKVEFLKGRKISKIVKFTNNTVTVKLMKLLFTQDLEDMSPVYNFSSSKIVVIQKKGGCNIVNINSMTELLKKDAKKIILLRLEFNPNYNCSYYNDACIMYERLKKNGIEDIVLINDDKYFNIPQKKFLLKKDSQKIKRGIEEYWKEYYLAEEFDYLE